MKRQMVFFASIFLLLMAAVSGYGTTVERLSFDDLVRRAQTIVHGKVVSSRTHWSPDGRLILTTTTFDVQEALKGRAQKTIDVTTVGGRIGNISLVVAGVPSFDPGEESIVFLEESHGLSAVLGLGQGKFSVRDGRVVNHPAGLTFPDGVPGAPLGMPLQEFRRQIQSRLLR